MWHFADSQSFCDLRTSYFRKSAITYIVSYKNIGQEIVLKGDL
jgi:hypothetical protein